MESGSSSAADDHWSITKLVSTTPVQDETESSNNNSGNQRLTFESDFALNHRALVEHTQNELRRLFENDSLLRDLPFDVTHDEVAAQIAVAKGQSITVYVKRGGFPEFKVVVPQSTTTVLHLKKAIRRHFELVQRRRRRVDDPPAPSTPLRSRSTTTDRGKKHANAANSNSSSSSIARTHRHHHNHKSSPRSHQSSSERKASRKSPDRSLEKLQSSKRPPNRNIAPLEVNDSKQQRISWRFVWKTYWLDLDDTRLTNDDKLIRDYGVINNSVLRFAKKRVRERSINHR